MGHLIPGAISASAVDNKGRHQCIFGMAPYSESWLAATVETLFRSSPVSNRNNVWFICSKVNTKGFFLSPSNACWTVQCSVSLLLLVFGFSPSGEILWRLAWLAAEKCHSRVRSKSAWCRRISAAPYFIKEVELWNSKAWKQNGISSVFGAAVPLGLYVFLHPKCTLFE